MQIFSWKGYSAAKLLGVAVPLPEGVVPPLLPGVVLPGAWSQLSHRLPWLPLCTTGNVKQSMEIELKLDRDWLAEHILLLLVVVVVGGMVRSSAVDGDMGDPTGAGLAAALCHAAAAGRLPAQQHAEADIRRLPEACKVFRCLGRSKMSLGFFLRFAIATPRLVLQIEPSVSIKKAATLFLKT